MTGFTLEPEGDGAAAEAVRLSAATAGVAVDPRPSAGAWWRAGVAEALERTPEGVVPARYEAARSPRSTRGATRA